MKLYMYSVYDSAVGAFLPPLFARSAGEALRGFMDACNDEKSNFYRHATDYSLMHLGEFEDQDAQFMLNAAPYRVVSAAECISRQIELESREPPGLSAVSRR